MVLYNGRYEWDGTKINDIEPITWFPGAYDLHIFETVGTEKIEQLKPHICVYARTGKGQSISANPEKFAKHICREFSLDLERVLWIEDHLSGVDRYEVNSFCKTGQVGTEIFYKITKRKASVQETKYIENSFRKYKDN